MLSLEIFYSIAIRAGLINPYQLTALLTHQMAYYSRQKGMPKFQSCYRQQTTIDNLMPYREEMILEMRVR